MPTPYDTRLPPHLQALKEEIEGYARGYGLDFFETIFEVVDADDLNEIAAYGGFPTRYPHWSFGMQYEELHKGYDYGLSKIYELVINNDPCYAYLMRSNHDVDQKLVMAHVYGHCLAPETRIETRDGIKAITNVQVGDEVLTHKGRYRRVQACARRWFKGRIRRVQISGCSEYVRITPEHPVYTLRGGKLRWIPAGELQSGDDVAWPRPRVRSECLIGAGTESDEPALIEASQWERQKLGDLADNYLIEIVRSVTTQLYDGYVYNFSVEKDESYTLAAGFVVHNCDFFKNNAYFAHTNRKMMDEMANHGARMRRYVEKYGEDEVEAFVDKCMSIDDLIDVHSTAIRRRDDGMRSDLKPEEEVDPVKATRFKSKDYMDEYINPRKVLEAEEEENRKARDLMARSFPEHPEKDVLLFLIQNAPMKGWQRDILEIVRDEAYYFAPQGQTKVCNEGWACLRSGSLIYTNRGLLPVEDLVNWRLPVVVHDGKDARNVYDWAHFADRETVWIKTRRGLELEGSITHRVMQPDGSWCRLDEVQIGGHVQISRGANFWAKEYVSVEWKPESRMTVARVAALVGVTAPTVYRHMRGLQTKVSNKLEILIPRYEADRATKSPMQNKRKPIRIPPILDEGFGAFLGYLIGDGHISVLKKVIGLTTGDESQADDFARLTEELFGIVPRKKWDQTKWRILFSSRQVQDLLIHLGLKTGFCARQKNVPDAILRSPKSVVVAFLRALYDCDGYAGKHGVILSTSSVEMSKTVQLLLLNFGVLSTRIPHKDGCWHVQTLGKSAEVFQREIGFGLERKQARLRSYIDGHCWFKEEREEDKIVAIERRRADVYDISVEETHRYAAQGFINHNSYWHSTIMTQKAMQPSEVIDFADHHSGTMAMQRGRLNPYKLGIELLRDIEDRWNKGRFGKEYDECDDLDKKRKWDLNLGLGRKKIFEVRRVHNDITFIDTFLTPEFCARHGFFSFSYQDQGGHYVIESREFEKIKQRLLFGLTNFGKPWIYVVDGNFRNRGELLLRHQFNGVEIRTDLATEVLTNVQFIWGRPVHLHTLVDGKPTMLSFDGTEHTTKTGGEIDDPRKHAPAKSR